MSCFLAQGRLPLSRLWVCQKKVRAIIEQGPPEDLVATFHKLFDEKIRETKSAAARAAKRYGLLPGLVE